MSCVKGMRRVYGGRKERCRSLGGDLWSMVIKLLRVSLSLSAYGVVFLPIKLKLSHILSFLIYISSFYLFPLNFFLNSNIISKKCIIQLIPFLNRRKINPIDKLYISNISLVNNTIFMLVYDLKGLFKVTVPESVALFNEGFMEKSIFLNYQVDRSDQLPLVELDVVHILGCCRGNSRPTDAEIAPKQFGNPNLDFSL